MGIAALFGVWFPEQEKEQGRSLDRRRGSTCPILYFTPTSSLTSCTCIPPMVVPNAPSLWLRPRLLFNAHPLTQSHKSRSGTEASLQEMPTSPQVSTCLLCDPERYFLAGPLMGPRCCRSISFPSNFTNCGFLYSHTVKPIHFSFMLM